MLDIEDTTETAAPYDVRILVADDDALARFILADQLDALGCRCIDTAADGLQALQLALASSYDLVFTDLCMPRMDGRALMAALRAHGKGMPVIAGTAWRESVAPVDGTPPHGFAAVLRKPFAMAQLRGLIEAHTGALPLGARGATEAGAPRHALYAAFATGWAEDDTVLRAALASLDGPAMLERLHRLHGALAVLGEGQARQACAQLQERIRREGIESCTERVRRFLRLCARIAYPAPRG